MDYYNIKWLQVENTTRCNAWCPGCARNIDGYNISPKLKIVDLDINHFQKILEMMPNLDVIQFCGTHGDTMAAPEVLTHLSLAMQYAKKLQIHTHGGYRNVNWWEDLAKMLENHDHDVWFTLDGLEGVHEIYRQGTNFNKIIDNATAFIKSGGHASWQFIPWKHNQHQIKDCHKLSQKLGFRHFRLIKSVRTDFQARHWKSGELIDIQPWEHNDRFNKREVQFIKNKVEIKNCRHLSLPSVYLNANGNISVCCEFNINRQHNVEDHMPDIKNELSTLPNKTCLKACGS